MKPITVCSLVYNRHDLLTKQAASLKDSTVRPAAYYVIDHGYNEAKVWEAIKPLPSDIPAFVITLPDPGVAHAGNWYLQHVPEERVLACDDIQFGPDTLEKMANTSGHFITPTWEGKVAGYPLFLIRDTCIEKVGLFDETLSPGYLYFEDWDHTHRMALAGIGIESVEAFFVHDNGGRNSLAKATPKQMDEHHRKFRLARKNFYTKWPELRKPHQLMGLEVW